MDKFEVLRDAATELRGRARELLQTHRYLFDAPIAPTADREIARLNDIAEELEAMAHELEDECSR